MNFIWTQSIDEGRDMNFFDLMCVSLFKVATSHICRFFAVCIIMKFKVFYAMIRVPLLALALLYSAGCSSVMIEEPLPGNPEPFDQRSFEGTWLFDGNVVELKFGSNGTAKIAGLEWKDDQFQLWQQELIVTKGTRHNFLSLRAEENGELMEDYFFAAYTFSDNGDLIVWIPEEDAFEKLVSEDVLEGSVTKGKSSKNILITSPPAKLLEILNDRKNRELFDYTEPIVFRKLILK